MIENSGITSYCSMNDIAQLLKQEIEKQGGKVEAIIDARNMSLDQLDQVLKNLPKDNLQQGKINDKKPDDKKNPSGMKILLYVTLGMAGISIIGYLAYKIFKSPESKLETVI